MDVSQAGSSVVLFALIALTPVCQFHPLAASLCCLLALAGVQDLVILAGEFSELNSFHLGQDCPQSSELNSFHLG